ncbi:MAG: type I-U CRISPR-associated protein Cas5/Cas6 [Acidimicrobiaceae bacterium]|nr:type I-U CRISPR-associated protein Cas5/Cas6 [Acidimicrobiaceae bacterium]
MTAIEVHFLTGRCSATSHHDRMEAEWPPHGARLYSAMVATWADADVPDESERAALEWLEALPPPRITAPEAVPRGVVSHFVPVNDVGVMALPGGRTKKERNLTFPADRLKKERHFPSVTLVEPQISGPSGEQAPTLPRVGLATPVTFAWDDSAPSAVAEALDGILGRVTRLGHSSSLVSCRLREEVLPATHTPGGGTLMLRWVRPGQLAALEEEHQRHQAIRPRSLPFRGVRYSELEPQGVDAADPARPSTAGDWIVFELEPRHRRMPMTRTVEVARVLRQSILRHVPDPLPEGVSGHLPDGTPTGSPHIAFLALPNVGHEHGDGRIMGLAVTLPQDLDEVARNAALRGIGLWERERGDQPLCLTMGGGRVVEMRRRQPPFALVSLRPPVWARSSRWWASVTPVALPTHPGCLNRGSATARAKAWARAEEAVAKSCEHVGLPRPADVQVSLVAHCVGARPANDYPVFRQGRGAAGGVVRRLVHASIEFAKPVRGPLMLGSGRFVGLGLMRPVVRAVGDSPAVSEGSNDG